MGDPSVSERKEYLPLRDGLFINSIYKHFLPISSPRDA